MSVAMAQPSTPSPPMKVPPKACAARSTIDGQSERSETAAAFSLRGEKASGRVPPASREVHAAEGEATP